MKKAKKLTNRRWTERERALLDEHYGLMPDEWIARKVRRTVGAIRLRASRNGLKRTEHFMTANQVAHIFGVWSSTVVLWIRRGLLLGEKSTVVRSGLHSVWHISYIALERFTLGQYHIYDAKRIDPIRDPHWFNLARRAGRKSKSHVPKTVRRWTDWEDAFLMNHHSQMTYPELGKKLRRTPGAVHARLKWLRKVGRLIPYKGYWKGRPREERAEAQRPWTAEEDQFLRENWGRPRGDNEPGRSKYLTNREIAAHIKRGVFACYTRAHRIGITGKSVYSGGRQGRPGLAGTIGGGEAR